MKFALALGGAYLLIALGLVAIGLSILHQFERATATIEISPTSTIAPEPTDFPLCVTVKPRPLIDRSNGNYDYRLGRGRRDGGVS
jgi:hypothetical protein